MADGVHGVLTHEKLFYLYDPYVLDLQTWTVLQVAKQMAQNLRMRSHSKCLEGFQPRART